ncbi:hypothetical protein WR25_11354 isoform A [Diploscapter pachys]|uniref:Aldehyde dehydrogenase n=2 Tax=Diploscapter pachys TaxID=2018661 RepID=A0A2A2LD51_9BILA|nr:hypothetical protein WR25_11354 isoform A [Diploscapter pachys]
MSTYHQLVEEQREYYRSGATRDLAKRKEVLLQLKQLFIDNKQAFDDAIYADLHRKSDSISEAGYMVHEIDGLLKNMDVWEKPEKFPLVLPHLKEEEDDVWLVREPLGVVLVISPWNYPLLTAAPFVTAIAAGNTVIVKPAELAPHFSHLFASLINAKFDKRLLVVVEGAVPETTELLKEKFDHIFYTGNPAVGKIIMAAAAKHLTPVTLELGGKNPVYVDADADLEDAAKKIVGVKIQNCGQICLNVDHILTDTNTKPKLLEAIKKELVKLEPLKTNPVYPRIIHEKHFDRLSNLLSKTKGRLYYKSSEESERADKFIAPHLLEIDFDDAFMTEEIFGPILVVLTIESFDKALDYIKHSEKPLGAYIFTTDPEKTRRFIRETSSGGVTVNSVMDHAMFPHLPFGGVGQSGMGKMHHLWTYDALTHRKTVFTRNGVGKKLSDI